MFRGKGVFQSAMDESIRKLDQGEWVSPAALLRSQLKTYSPSRQIHIFSEGKVNQPTGAKSVEDHILRFKWGVYVFHSGSFVSYWIHPPRTEVGFAWNQSTSLSSYPYG